MPLYSVTDVSSVGVVTDVDPVLLPPPAWTEAKNARFSNNSAQKFLGHSSVATPTVAPYGLVPVIKGTTAYWVYPGLAKVYAYDGSNHANITRQDAGADDDYTGTAADLWNGGVLNGVLILNNGKDDPQMWVGSDLESLTWDSGNSWADMGYTAKVIRPYKNFLVALRWHDGTDEYPQSVYWSNQAEPLTVPSDWDFADPAVEANIATLAATQGYILDGEALRDSFAIYKEDAIHMMSYQGGALVMQFTDVSKTTGSLSQRCAKEFYGRHLVFANDDILVHDGQNAESVADKRIRRAIFSDIDPSYYTNAFVARNLARQEMWCCYTTTGNTLPNLAAVWNWRDNTWAFRELPSLTHLAFGILPSTTGVTTWNADSDPWDSDTEAWGERLYNPASQQLVGAASGDLFALDSTTQFDGTDIDSYVVREGILLDGQMTTKMVRAVYLRATGGTMQVSVGAKFDANDSYVWEGPYSFVPGDQYKVPMRVTGRFHALKVCFCGSSESELYGYDIEYEVVGGR